MADAHKNFAYSTVATAPSPASSGTSLVVAAGDGALFPTPPFNATIWPVSSQPTSTNAEIVRVTAIVSDTLTITRSQENSSARTVIIGDLIAATATAKTFTDIEPIIDYLEPRQQTNTSAFVPGIGSWYLAPFVAPGQMAGGRINNLIVNTSTAGIAIEASSVSFITNAGHMGNKTQAFTHSFWNAMYSQGTGTNSTRLESFWSNSFSFALTNYISITSSGAGSSVVVSDAWSISYISEIGSDGAYTLNQYANAISSTGTGTRMAVAAITNGASSIRNMLSNSVIYPVGFNTTISQGNYWMAQMYSFTTASTTNAAYTVASAVIMSQVNGVYIQGVALESYRNWASTATTARSQVFPGQGAVYTAASAVPPQYILFSSDLATVAGNNVPYFNFVNQGITK